MSELKDLLNAKGDVQENAMPATLRRDAATVRAGRPLPRRPRPRPFRDNHG